ncbi:hypothetical protein GCM10008938_33250 [Deinococcus roseus]|uniref:Uncharacterized protein n=2 Tax=Deinococcus roseus TaxID=392414 RepID=A0ABQ2D3D2_9DEIO|nr:hypothetical protein GCM10008938_33250 [Deinococcus roseus]
MLADGDGKTVLSQARGELEALGVTPESQQYWYLAVQVQDDDGGAEITDFVPMTWSEDLLLKWFNDPPQDMKDLHYHNGKLVNGFDYELQVWVVNGICDHVGLNRERFGGKPWETARLEMLGEKLHHSLLLFELSDLGYTNQLRYVR